MRLFRRASAAASAPAPTIASVDVSTVAHRFNWEWATSEPIDGLDTYWWWARSIRVDPNEVIADDGEGNLWSIPFTTDGEDDVTFGEPVRVRETYVPVAAADGATATAVVQRRRQRVLASTLEQPTKPDPTTAASATTTPEEEARPMTDEQRRTLAASYGLPEDATEEQVMTAAAEAAAAQTTPETPEEPETPEPEAITEPETPAEQPEPVAASTVTLDRETYDQLRRGAEDGVAARAQQLRAEREQIVATAIQEGRIPPARRDHWLTQLEADFDGASATIADLAPGTIPVSERGATPTTDNANPDSLKRVLAFAGLGGRQEKN